MPPSLSAEAERLKASTNGQSIGSVGVLIFPNANGAPSAKITARMATPGIISRTIMPVPAPIVGAKTALPAFSDRHQHICFALAMWNEKDPILKERLFGLTNREGNHGEDVKEYYYYLDATPTSSYLKYLYKYPQAEYSLRSAAGGKRKTDPPGSRI